MSVCASVHQYRFDGACGRCVFGCVCSHVGENGVGLGIGRPSGERSISTARSVAGITHLHSKDAFLESKKLM